MNKPKIEVRLYRMRNRLMEKAGGIGATAENSDFPVHILEETEHLFQEMISDYPDWVQDSLSKLSGYVEVCINFENKRIVTYKSINEIAHEMKGQGGTFGYPLVSTFGDSLYDFTGPNAGLSDNHVQIIKAHVDAMKATINGRIQGDGGQIGQELKKMLSAAIRQYQ
ncbi:hypothetical protein GUA87_07645 [Sneathiella sp. P13V-1]|uniref:hypothetical protein n=1 Tax=Sneathiella sp. P13V-1 TaxID=2697366 RepID=UPI00187B27AF|nr:hypothetical protein [Sneathiella sp. P13V-1]MBE7636716.1 hypothetical protein [Sneathiella sp. P13V-1]